MRRAALLTLLFAAALPLLATDPAPDPVLGTWNLNVAKSRYDPGPPPKSQTRTYAKDKDGVKAVSITVYKNGNTDTVHYPANYDGKEHPVLGDPDTDGIIMTRVDEYTAESVLTHAGKTIGIVRRTVAKDGKSMIITFKGTGSSGEQVNNRAFYEKVE